MILKSINKFLNPFDLQLIKQNNTSLFPEDFNDSHKKIYSLVKDYTMTSPERIWSFIESINYVNKHAIEGAIVECGVWKGGSIMAALLRLMELKDSSREVYLYDTFEGMSEPTEYDIDPKGNKAATLLNERIKDQQDHVWAYSPLEDVQQRVFKTNYPKEKIHFIKGKVEETIPGVIPEKISILRLDTDWYESTKHELYHLFPKLVKGGILILDDYGHWSGAKKATDEFINENNICILLNRIDQTGRIAIKQ
ncbi:MAG: TylF/MycF/NovP-related O-methyltransferase [Bacteroidota bacterium]|jgi:O-methyltransferase